jgi:hypothetical protein
MLYEKVYVSPENMTAIVEEKMNVSAEPILMPALSLIFSAWT